MRVLVVEDDQYRINKFKHSLIGNVVDYALNAPEARDFINQNEYDLIFMDHDLGGEINMESERENTGFRVTQYMVINKLNKKAVVVCHSCNPAGADRISKLLHECGYIYIKCPFVGLNIDDAVHEAEKVRNHYATV